MKPKSKILELNARRGGKKRRSPLKEWPARYSRLMREAIEALGGPQEACKILAARGRTPLDVAIALLGGPTQTADKMGLNRQRFYRMMAAGTKKWDGEWLGKLSELSGVPIAMLMRSAEEAANDDGNGLSE